MSEERFIKLLNHYRARREDSDVMTPEERILTALNCEVPDRVPVCLPGFDFYKWADESYDGLLDEIAASADPLYDVFLGYDPFKALKGLVKESMPNGNLLEKISTPKGNLTQISTSETEGEYNFPNRIKHWIQTPEDVERFLSIPYKPAFPDLVHNLEIAQQVQGWVPTILTINEPLQCLEGMLGASNLCLWVAMYKDLIQELQQTLYKRIVPEIEYLNQLDWNPVFRLTGSEIVIPPMMSVASYDEFAFFYQKDIIKRCHAHNNKVIIHAHNYVGGVLDKFVEVGADGTDPCEPPPMGDLNLAEAKKRVGNKMSLWGNIEYNELTDSTEERIEILVKETVKYGAPGGGFGLVPCLRLYERTITPKTRRNMLRFIEAGRKYGQYPMSHIV